MDEQQDDVMNEQQDDVMDEQQDDVMNEQQDDVMNEEQEDVMDGFNVSTNNVLQNNNPEEAQNINIVADFVNNNNPWEDDIDSIPDDEDQDVELFDDPEDEYPDLDDDPDDPDDPNDGEPFQHLTEFEKQIVNDFRSVCVLDNPISHFKVG